MFKNCRLCRIFRNFFQYTFKGGLRRDEQGYKRITKVYLNENVYFLCDNHGKIYFFNEF